MERQKSLQGFSKLLAWKSNFARPKCTKVQKRNNVYSWGLKLVAPMMHVYGMPFFNQFNIDHLIIIQSWPLLSVHG